MLQLLSLLHIYNSCGCRRIFLKKTYKKFNKSEILAQKEKNKKTS